MRLGYAAAPLLGQGGVAAPSNKWPRSFERRGRGGLFKHRVFGAMGACGGSWFSEFIIETRRNQNGWNCGILVLQLRQRYGNICNADSSRVRKFRRQHSIGPYIVDFYCPECRLIVELDGQPHYEFIADVYEAERTKYFSQFGIKVVRFENRLVFEALEAVLATIRRELLPAQPDQTVDELPVS